MRSNRSCISYFSYLVAAALLAAPARSAAGGDPVKSQPFQGIVVSKGTVTLQQDCAQWSLTLSDDFVVPNAPAPHWQVTDARGNVYLLQRLVAKDDKFHKSIVLPGYIADVAKVQIWCAFAEVLLGETGFGKVVTLGTPAMTVTDTTSPFKGVKANRGTASIGRLGAQRVLSLSDDFVVPDTPAPHWQVVDSKGNVHMLQRLIAKDDKYNRTVALPAYVGDVVKVQIWCAFAETLLGEAAFAKPGM